MPFSPGFPKSSEQTTSIFSPVFRPNFNPTGAPLASVRVLIQGSGILLCFTGRLSDLRGADVKLSERLYNAQSLCDTVMYHTGKTRYVVLRVLKENLSVCMYGINLNEEGLDEIWNAELACRSFSGSDIAVASKVFFFMSRVDFKEETWLSVWSLIFIYKVHIGTTKGTLILTDNIYQVFFLVTWRWH